MFFANIKNLNKDEGFARLILIVFNLGSLHGYASKSFRKLTFSNSIFTKPSPIFSSVSLKVDIDRLHLYNERFSIDLRDLRNGAENIRGLSCAKA